MPPIAETKLKHWGRSYVVQLLSNRAVLGEYQPHTRRGGERRPEGPAVKDYYPAAVTEELWHAARKALAGRRGKDGRPPKGGWVNVFSGLLHDARGGGPLHVVNKGAGRVLVPYQAANGVAPYVSFPLPPFEGAVLSKLRELKAEDVFPTDAGRVGVLEGKLADAEADVEKFKARLAAKFSEAVADVLDRKAEEVESLRAELEAARAEAASPPSAALADLRALDRLLLRSALRRAVESVWCLFIGGRERTAIVQAFFPRGAVRWYRVHHRQGDAHGAPAATQVETWTLPALGAIDMRRPADAKLVEALNRRLPAVERLR